MARQRFVPKIAARGSNSYDYFELSMARGPEQIGVTGDNSYEVLYGRSWLLNWDREDDHLKLYQQDAVGEWVRITDELPGVFAAPMPSGARRVTFAFDQSARIIVVYEIDGTVYVTRWDPSTNQYIQNVTFAGRDPCVLMDATIMDPLGYPNQADDGWSVRDAYQRGIRILFNWIPDGVWRESAIPDSDILLFYLSSDRTQVRCRVQRELYAVVNTIFTYADPIIMDRAVALLARYELLVSAVSGDKLPNMLVSDKYVVDYIISPEASESLDGLTTPEALRSEVVIFKHEDDGAIDGSMSPETIEAVSNVYPYVDDEALDGTMAPETAQAASVVYPTTDDDAIDGGMSPEGDVTAITTTIRVEGDEALDGTMTPEAIRVQTV